MNRHFQFGRTELRQILYKFRREFYVVGLFSGISNLLMLTPTLYMLQVYDRVLVSRNEFTLAAVSVLALLLLAVMAITEWMRSRVLVKAGMRIDDMLSTRVFQASFDASLQPQVDRHGRAFSDLTELRQFITGSGIFAVFDLPWAPIYTAILFLMHPLLGWLAVAFAIVQGGVAWWAHRQAQEPNQSLYQAQAEEMRFLQSKLRNAETIESMGMFSALLQRWLKRHASTMEQHQLSHGKQHRATAFSKFIRYCQQSFMLGAGALLVIDGQLTPGAMIAANVLGSRALAPIDMIVGSWKTFLTARAAFQRLETLLEANPPRDPALQRVPPTGELTLRNVYAHAPDRNTPILQNINLTFQPGTITVVIGPSGSGKSTLTRVIVGIWPLVHGEVLLDGSPLDSWSRDALGSHIGYLPQDVELFDGTIAQNIARMGEEDSTGIIEAAEITGLHPIILRFPKGYDTPMGEAGQLLSGGQRQRVALARALYGKPPLIVLDEPNANLDDAGEAALQQALQTVRSQGKTIVVVSHRPGVLAVADRIVVMHAGTVHDHGPRNDVLRRLHAAQSSSGGKPNAALPNPNPEADRT